MDLSRTRKEHAGIGLDPERLDPDPRVQFERWFLEAGAAGFLEPNAMALATVGADGRPSLRMVLLKSFDEMGFVFCTNLESRKARELTVNPSAALLWYWDKLERQVRLEGGTERLSAGEADRHFAARPRGSQLAAWASAQSEVLASRQQLEARVLEFDRRYLDDDVPRPEFWGGFRLVPREFEFWQGRENRLHDRVRYRRSGETWVRERLSP